MENVRKHRDITIVTDDKKRSILVSEPNYHSTKCISEDLLIMETKKCEVYMNKPIYLGQAMLDISKRLMYEFWYDYLKPMYGDNIKLCCMVTDSFVIYVKTDDFYKDIGNYIDKWFDTSNYTKDIDRPLVKGKNKKVIGKFKDELGGVPMTEFSALRSKTYAYKLDNDDELKKAKGTKKCVVKRNITFNNYVDVLFDNKKLLRSLYPLRSYNHRVYTEKVKKIALRSNDDKRLQTSDKITTYPYGFYDITKNELKTLIGEAHDIRNNSKTLIEEAHDIRKTSNDIRNELRILIEEGQAIRNNSKTLIEEAHDTRNNSKVLRENACNIRNNSKILIEEGQAIRNNSKVLREDACNIRKTSNDIRNELKILIEEGQAIRNNSKTLIKEAHNIRNNSKIFIEEGQGIRNNSKTLIKEAYNIRNNSKIFIEEGEAIRNNSKVLRENACNIRNELKILTEEAHDIRNSSKILREDACDIKKNI